MLSNAERSITEPGQVPAEVIEVARGLLSEVSFAMSLLDPATAVSLTRGRADAKLWQVDEDFARSMFASSAAGRVTMRTSILAPLFRRIAKYKRRELEVAIGPESRDASERRSLLQLRAQRAGLAWLDWTVNSTVWPVDDEGEPRTPIDIALSVITPHAVLLTPDQYRASGVIEAVRAAGKLVGDCDGDGLAHRFMKMILDFGGASRVDCDGHVEAAEADPSLVEGGFLTRALASSFDAPAELLSGPEQHLAMTILAAWLRMSHLGVRLSSLERLRDWRRFFDGWTYNAPESLVGEAWRMSESELERSLKRMTLVGPMKDANPWHVAASGTPLVFVGIAAELIRFATIRCGILDTVSDGFFVPEPGEITGEDFSEALDGQSAPKADRLLLQLRHRHSALVSTTLGCCRDIALVQNYRVK